MLDDARFAPSGGNRQPWRVALIEDRASGAAMADADAAGVGRVRRPLGARRHAVQGRRRRRRRERVEHAANPLLDEHRRRCRSVLVVAAELRGIAMMDNDVGRVPITGGASIYPFCWSILLAAHGAGSAA